MSESAEFHGAYASDAAGLASEYRHALRTPLNQILGYAELLIEDAEARGLNDLLPDLRKIQGAGRVLQGLLEGAAATSERTAAPDSAAAIAYAEAALAASASAQAADDDLAYLRQFLPPEPKGEGELLVVDDSAENREVLTRLLERWGYTVTPAAGGAEAMSLLRARLEDRPFDLLLLDIIMPGVNGWEVLQQVKGDERLKAMPVIMISGLDDVHAVVRCLELGAADFVAKPFEPAILKARVSASLEVKRSQDRERWLHAQLSESYRQLREFVASEDIV